MAPNCVPSISRGIGPSWRVGAETLAPFVLRFVNGGGAELHHEGLVVLRPRAGEYRRQRQRGRGAGQKLAPADPTMPEAHLDPPRLAITDQCTAKPNRMAIA